MPRNANTGMTTQRLAIMLRNRLRGSQCVEAGDYITTGLDGGTEFSFFANGRDGAEFVVTITQTKHARVDLSAGTVQQPSQIAPWVERREAKIREQQERGLAKREQLRLQRLDRRRKAWLGPGS
jgi:hypothetical protein